MPQAPRSATKVGSRARSRSRSEATRSVVPGSDQASRGERGKGGGELTDGRTGPFADATSHRV
eukprot:8464924-Pyramimonas_sp.AAC.1